MENGMGRARGRGRAEPRDIHREPIPRPGAPGPLAMGAVSVRPQQPPDIAAPAGRGSFARQIPGGTAASQPGALEINRGGMRGRRLLAENLRTRPDHVDSKKGTTGVVTTLRTNYFRISHKSEWKIHQYRVDFAPDVETTAARKALMREHKSQFTGFLFDGTILFTLDKFETKSVQSKRLDGSPVKIDIRPVGEIAMNDQASLQVLNLILRRSMEGLHLQLVGRNYFDAIAKIPIHDFRLELWPGYITSIRQHEYDILMCAELSSKVMRMETLADILEDCTRNFRDPKDEFARAVIGTTVLTDYSNKTYRIDDVDWDKTPRSTFSTKGGGETSFIDYYKQKYNIRIRDEGQPLVMSRPKDRDRRGGQQDLIALIPELCRATGLTDEMKSNFRLMKAVGEHTRIGPAQRIRRLQTFNQRVSNSPDSIQILREWNMSLDSQLVEVSGRELPQEKIVFCDREAPGSTDADWTREFRNSKFYTTVPLNNWFLIAPKRTQREASEFVRVLQDAVRNMGFTINRPNMCIIENDRNDEIVREIENCARNDPQLIMIVVTNNNSARYAAIKKKCCIDRAIPTQVIVLKTITPKDGNFRSLMSVGTKVAIQLNCKLGAAPWFVKLPLTGLMTVGFDVSHDTKNRTVSYGALVATMDLRSSCKYFSAISVHRDSEELTNELGTNMTKALREYRNEHGELPPRIVFYRDGVGEGQIQYVHEVEIQNLIKVLDKHYQTANQPLKFAFVVVNKRINTRIFKGDKNPIPGTVVDDVITIPERYDFYLVSQSVRQGTVAPTSYNVIYDTLMLPPDKMQLLTYKMCHLYYNWSGTTRVPAVCQYAHKLAFLVGEHLHQSPSQSLQKQLYFL